MDGLTDGRGRLPSRDMSAVDRADRRPALLTVLGSICQRAVRAVVPNSIQQKESTSNDLAPACVPEREKKLSFAAAPDLPPFAAWLVTRPDLWRVGFTIQQAAFRRLQDCPTGAASPGRGGPTPS